MILREIWPGAAVNAKFCHVLVTAPLSLLRGADGADHSILPHRVDVRVGPQLRSDGVFQQSEPPWQTEPGWPRRRPGNLKTSDIIIVVTAPGRVRTITRSPIQYMRI